MKNYKRRQIFAKSVDEFLQRVQQTFPTPNAFLVVKLTFQAGRLGDRKQAVTNDDEKVPTSDPKSSHLRSKALDDHNFATTCRILTNDLPKERLEQRPSPRAPFVARKPKLRELRGQTAALRGPKPQLRGRRTYSHPD